MITEERTRSLRENWNKEAENTNTLSWREALSLEESGLVRSWDRDYARAMASMGEK